MRASGRRENWSASMRPVNVKLAGRAARVITALTGESLERSQQLLKEADNRIGAVVLMARKGVGIEEARRMLEEAGSLRRALQSVKDEGAKG